MSHFKFSQGIKVGELGETLFFEANCKDLIREDGRNRDFSFRSTGEGLELKTDYYGMDKTPNLFIERYSDATAKTPGGPWQAKVNGTEWFCYFFIKDLTYFIFNTEELVVYLDKNLHRFEPKEIKNGTYHSLGYRVPRELVIDMATEHHLKVSIKKARGA